MSSDLPPPDEGFTPGEYTVIEYPTVYASVHIQIPVGRIRWRDQYATVIWSERRFPTLGELQDYFEAACEALADESGGVCAGYEITSPALYQYSTGF